MSRILTILFSFTFFISASASDLLVGIATTDVTPAVSDNIPLGGYGSLERRNWPFHFYKDPIFRTFRVAEGKLDAIRAKAMFVKKGDKQLLFIGLDVIGVTKDLHNTLVERLASLGFAPETIFVSGTHTHSGPGALSNNFLWEIIAMDRFQKTFYEKYIGQIVDTVHAAVAKAQVAELYTINFETHGLVHNRRGSGKPLNQMAHMMVARGVAGDWLGGMVNFAVHGTSLKESNLFFSSDVPGAIERELEKTVADFNGYFRPLSQPEFIFINGAEGDVAPKMDYLELGAEFARQASSVWDTAQPLNPEWTVRQETITIDKPKVALEKCVEGKWMPKNVNLGVKKWISSQTLISQVHFGNLWLVTWPGEAITDLGTRLIAQSKEAGAEDVWFMGLTNDHLAYFLTPEEFAAGGYESCSTFFGANGGLKIIEAHKNLSQKL